MMGDTARSRSLRIMAKRLFIVGAGGFGREVADWAAHWLARSPGYVLQGFLDDNLRALDGFASDLPVLGPPRTFEFQAGDAALIAIGNPKVRRDIAHSLEGRVTFPILIHPAAIIGSHCLLDEGCIICPGTVVTTNVRLGKHVIANLGCSIGHDSTLGDYTTLSPHVSISGGASTGEGVFIGSNASLVPMVKVGANAVVGACSLVLRAVPPDVTVFGIPARQHTKP